LWNLATSLEEPTSQPDGISIHKVMGQNCQAVNKLQWSLDGKRLAVTTGDQLHILGVSEDVSCAKVMKNLVP